MKAPVFQRIAAWIIDVAIAKACALCSLIVAYLFWEQSIGNPLLGLMSFIFVFATFVIPGSFILLRDSLSQGRGVGKKVMRIRVVRSDGSRCDMISSILRNLTFLIPLLNIAEMIIAVAAKDGRRMGDRLAKTQVIE